MSVSVSQADGGAVERADVAVATEAGKARHHPVVRGLGALSEIADQAPSVAACGAFLLFGLATRRPRVSAAGAGMLASVLVAAALKSGAKALVSRTRPQAVLEGDAYEFDIDGRDGPEDHSFPSGHTAGAVAVARAIARHYPAGRGPAYGAAALIALVQIPRGKHYPADLAAGAVVGVLAEGIVAAGTAALRRAR